MASRQYLLGGGVKKEGGWMEVEGMRCNGKRNGRWGGEQIVDLEITESLDLANQL